MTDTSATLYLLSRVPRPGETKTRLAADCGDAVASAFHLASLGDLLPRLRTALSIRCVLAWASAPREGDLLPPIPDGWETKVQPEGDLGARLASLARDAAGPAIFVGADAPTQPEAAVGQALALLADGRDAVFQPARDGGYVLAAFASAPGWLVERIPWGTERVLATTLQRAEAVGARVELLPPWYDVDTGEDLEALRQELNDRNAGFPALRRFFASLDFESPSQP